MLLQEKTSIKRISELIDTDKSTVYREISRNKNLRGGYNAKHTQMVSVERKERFGRMRRFTLSMEKFIRNKITQDQWSPEQITGYCRLCGTAMVSHERIYQFIRADKENGDISDIFRIFEHKCRSCNLNLCCPESFITSQ